MLHLEEKKKEQRAQGQEIYSHQSLGILSTSIEYFAIYIPGKRFQATTGAVNQI